MGRARQVEQKGRGWLALALALVSLIGSALILAAAIDQHGAAEPRRAHAQPPPRVEPEPEPEPEPQLDPGDRGPPLPRFSGGVEGLSAAQRAIFYASPSDPSPEFLDGVDPSKYGTHFYCSDEWNQQVFAPAITGLGGGYVGVGATQGYVMIGWARPEFAWFIDYDDVVVELHEVWRVLFELATSPEEVRQLWAERGRRRAIAALREAGGERLVRAYRSGRHRVDNRLELLRAKHRRLGIDSYLSDAETFDYVRGMVLSGRVRAMRVDLTAAVGLAGIGEAARALGVVIRILYTSNAQTYWKYAEGRFIEGVRALPFDAESVVLHTVGTQGSNGDYRYLLHSGLGFRASLVDGASTVFSLSPWRPRSSRGPRLERFDDPGL